MTRASSSSNKLRFSQKEYLTHRKVPLAVMTLAMFMADIIVPVMFISDVNHANIWQNVNKIFSSENFIWTLVVLFLGIYLGVDSFHYLHVEKQVDFYESQPLTRKQRFFGIVLNSVLAYVALSAVFMLLGILETAGMTGPHLGQIFADAAVYYFLCFGVYLASYALTVLAMTLTGNTLVAILGTAYFMLFELLVRCVAAVYYHSLCTTTVGTNVFKHVFTNPYALVTIGYKHPQPYMFWLNCLLGLAYLALAYWALQKRGSETAGQALSFKWCETVVTVSGVVLGTILAASFGYSMFSKNLPATFALALLAGLVLGAILQVIYRFDAMAWKKRFVCNLLLTAIGLAVFGAMDYASYKHDAYVPDQDKVASMAVFPPARDYWSTYYTDKYMASGKEVSAFQYRSQMKLDPALAYDLGKEGAKKAVKDRGLDSSSEFDMYVIYRLKNGKQIRRYYDISMKAMDKYFQGVSQSAEFRKSYYQLYQDQALLTSKNVIRLSNTNGYSTKSLKSKQLYKEFRTAYKKDLESKWSWLMAKKTEEIGTVTVSVSGTKVGQDYPVYKSYVNTLRVLKKYKLNLPLASGQYRDNLTNDFYIGD